MHKFAKFHQNRPNSFGDIAFFIFKMAAVYNLDFSKFHFFVADFVESVNVHNRFKFHQNWSNGFEDIAFNGFQNNGHLSSWISKNWKFEQTLCSGGSICVIVQKYHQTRPVVMEILQYFDFQYGGRGHC